MTDSSRSSSHREKTTFVVYVVVSTIVIEEFTSLICVHVRSIVVGVNDDFDGVVFPELGIRIVASDLIV